ncbi:uncharacterized protein PGTG_22658 [Puccinia graminis f. sp. tritici CRL 75-36-700-3]|uniref:Uncharacterized protein n=1 Tax=Puccinia graminis f. sp. tritici (strain CRL 75-36-700-3 / race SCCL) TaxID=418459 RepID=H6QV69_PUCGT|nr:uncharacterized protein PGTG_22658 [Puccinia graminis f. sp. tritici CRL 75-36-700-3]EHS62730.1 hypothetical protein PGTG_22658 [Puccinia graminis f. sp. tritici CRL 75-36-700-3]
MKKLFLRKGKPLNKLRPTPMKKWNSEITDQLVPEQIDSDVSSEGDSEPSEEDSGDNGGSGDDENDGRDEENNSGTRKRLFSATWLGVALGFVAWTVTGVASPIGASRLGSVEIVRMDSSCTGNTGFFD